MNFNIKDYLISRLWLNDEYLITPDGIKKCRICDKRKYSVDFFEHDEFADGHFPMCAKCLRSVKFGVLSRTMLNDTGFTVKCVRCDAGKKLGQMSMSYSERKVSKICSDCSRRDFERIKK